MGKVSREQLKSWFRRGMYPLESQFANWIDSFFHKEDTLPMSSIGNLTETLNSKAEKTVVDAKQDKQDAGLQTDSKTIVGAINEVSGKLGPYDALDTPYTSETANNEGVENVEEALDDLYTTVNAIPDPMHYTGTWNASTNTPALKATDTAKSGYVYRVTTAGAQFGLVFKTGDRLVYNEAGQAEKWDTTDEVWSVNGKTGDVKITKTDLGLGNVDNTSDVNKPVSKAVREALDSLANETMAAPMGVFTTNAEVDNCISPGNYGVFLYEEPDPLFGEQFTMLVLNVNDDGDMYMQVGIKEDGDGMVMAIRSGSSGAWGEWRKVAGEKEIHIPDLNVAVAYGESKFSDVGSPVTIQHYTKGDEEFLKLNPTIVLMRRKRTFPKNGDSHKRSDTQKSKWVCPRVGYDGRYTPYMPDLKRICEFDFKPQSGRYCPTTTVSGKEIGMSVNQLVMPFVVHGKDDMGDNCFSLMGSGRRRNRRVIDLVRTIQAVYGLCIRIDNPAFDKGTWDESEFYAGNEPRYLYGRISPLLFRATAYPTDSGYRIEAGISVL